MKRTIQAGLVVLAIAVAVLFVRDQMARSAYRQAVSEAKLVPRTWPDRYAHLLDTHAIQAEKSFQRALSLYPRNAAWRHEYGRLLCRVKNYEKCQAEIALAARLDPTDTDIQATLKRLADIERNVEMERQRDTNAEFARTLAEEQAQQQERARILHDR